MKPYYESETIDVEWEQLSHEEAKEIYDKIITGEIEVYEN